MYTCVSNVYVFMCICVYIYIIYPASFCHNRVVCILMVYEYSMVTAIETPRVRGAVTWNDF